MSKVGAALRRRMSLMAAVVLMPGDAARADDRNQAATDKPLVRMDEHGFTLRSPDDIVNFHLGGRLHMDFGSGGSPAVTDAFPNNFAVRRMWIEPMLTINKDLIFNLQYDATSELTPIGNLLVSYKGFAPFTFTGGNFKEPFSLEVLTSNNNTTFMERSLMSTFSPTAGRSTGFAIGTHGTNWTLAAGVFGRNINSSADHGGTAGTIRATYAPILTPNEVLHFGVAGSYRSLDQSRPDVSFASSPESFLFTAALVDTGTIGANAIGRLGLEFAWANGPFRLQAEYIATQVERVAAGHAAFQGGYLQAAWVINGKSPRYALDANVATEIGMFSRVQPESDQRVSHGGVGVFEVAARYSAIDLTSRDIQGGGFQQDVTLGLNWYPEPFIRVMANYIHAWANPTAQAVTGRSAEADIGQIRLQIAF
ncbi:OprO/OprP family phosphate-selective porin [Bradyrhizobium valentinum]|nr:porin [Bradyrhizobium valentinum]